MSAACCARRNCCRRGPSTRPAASRPRSCARVEDEAIRDAVRMQQELGLQGVTDGEFRRGSWHMDFLYRIGGVAKTERAADISSSERERHASSSARPRIGSTGKLTLDKTIFGEDFAFLKSVAPPGRPRS